MKSHSFYVWLTVNLVLLAGVCYIAVVVRLRSTNHQPTPSTPLPPASPPASQPASLRPDHTVHARPPPPDNSATADRKRQLERHQHDVMTQLRLSLINHRKQLPPINRTVGVAPNRRRPSVEPPPRQLLCQFQQAISKSNFRLLGPDCDAFAEPDRRQLMAPERFAAAIAASSSRLDGVAAPTCAVVSSAGALLGSGLGAEIDAHDFVVRFNDAPTDGFEGDVGSRTHLRVVNSQVVSGRRGSGFTNSSLFDNVTVAVWDPVARDATLEQWLRKPEFPFLEAFLAFRRARPEQDLHLVDPRGLWDLWNLIDSHSPLSIPSNPPSSGFIGLALILPWCRHVDLFEFVPSVRMTARCHYYSTHEDLGCTLGEWHPLAAEKLLYMALNTAEEEDTFGRGFVRVPGFPSLDC